MSLLAAFLLGFACGVFALLLLEWLGEQYD